MVEQDKPDPSEIFVWSEIVSEEEYEERRKRLLDVSYIGLAADGADEFVVSAEVAASAADFYALVDWADERNAKRQSGDTVTTLDQDGRRFRLVVEFMRDMHFDYEVLTEERPTNYAYECLIVPPQGNLGRTVEEFRIDPLAEDHCGVTMSVRAFFDAGLNEEAKAQAIHTMTVGAHNGLARLKAYAEYGVGTIEAFDNLQLMSL